ncbi:MAG: hypothetical protein EOP86_25555 [Verrucomicrobiaceae bacterium]|nr:MAG: hypothetical protein EOP86_25555 [Verrucomicrobiaceae bacterium]
MSNPSPFKDFQPYEPSELDRRMQACAPGAYPWDDWQREALAAGLSPELAALGRAVMREAYQHNWCAQLKYESGIDNPDTAAGMILCAKSQPYLTESRWQWLLETDGLRFDPWHRAEWQESSPEWNEMRLRWQMESLNGKTQTPENRLLYEALDYLTFFYKLNQLAIIDLTQYAVSQADGAAMLWADFTVIGTEIPHRITHSGVVRIEQNPSGVTVDAAIFETPGGKLR